MQRCLLFGLALVLVSTGCAHYGHSHQSRLVPIYSGTPLYDLLTGTNRSSAPNPIYIRETKDRAGSTLFFVMGKAATIKSVTRDEGGYEKQLDIGGLEGKVDGDAIKASFSGIGEAVGEGFRASMGLPSLPIPAGSTVPAEASPLVESFKAGLQRYLAPKAPVINYVPRLTAPPQGYLIPPPLPGGTNAPYIAHRSSMVPTPVRPVMSSTNAPPPL